MYFIKKYNKGLSVTFFTILLIIGENKRPRLCQKKQKQTTQLQGKKNLLIRQPRILLSAAVQCRPHVPMSSVQRSSSQI